MSLSWLLTNLVAAFLLPPLNALLPAALGLLLLRRRPRLGKGLLAFGLLALAVMSLPVVAKAMLRPLEQRHPALPLAELQGLDADAIVVLGGGRNRLAPEFAGSDQVTAAALARLRYGALLARTSGKPVLVSGGRPEGEGRPEAAAMRETLARDFGVEAKWAEDGSDDTRQNARYSAEILLPLGIRRIALVTHAWHMPRAVIAYEAAGFEVLPAPTDFLATPEPLLPVDFLPRVEAMRLTGIALHEAIGLVWYRWRS